MAKNPDIQCDQNVTNTKRPSDLPCYKSAKDSYKEPIIHKENKLSFQPPIQPQNENTEKAEEVLKNISHSDVSSNDVVPLYSVTTCDSPSHENVKEEQVHEEKKPSYEANTNIVCQECNIRFRKEPDLFNHMETVHKTLSKPREILSSQTVQNLEIAPLTASINHNISSNPFGFGRTLVQMTLSEKPKMITPKLHTVMSVRCNSTMAFLYKEKFESGAKGQCILLNNKWLTPNQFEEIAGSKSKESLNSIKCLRLPLSNYVDSGELKLQENWSKKVIAPSLPVQNVEKIKIAPLTAPNNQCIAPISLIQSTLPLQNVQNFKITPLTAPNNHSNLQTSLVPTSLPLQKQNAQNLKIAQINAPNNHSIAPIQSFSKRS